LNLQFTYSGMDGDALVCQSLDGFLTNNNCPATVNNNQSVSVDFFAGDPIPNRAFFVLGEIGLPTTVQTTVPAYDPNTLVLLAAGIALLGMAAMRRSA
ncbi:MAG TPA: hypothetical protein VKG84_05100, partial [Candidatus Acidoferrales bacterium]|nr:hypothetical protein [Candidatus Acidoferrales bacterium]